MVNTDFRVSCLINYINTIKKNEAYIFSQKIGYLSNGIAGSPATNLGMIQQASSSAALSPPPTQSTLSGSQNSLFEGIYGI
jgi:hypothetical protein